MINKTMTFKTDFYNFLKLHTRDLANVLHWNQKYGDETYLRGHLDKVVYVFEETIERLIEEKVIELNDSNNQLICSLMQACYLHDTLEDCNITYNGLISNLRYLGPSFSNFQIDPMTPSFVADIVYDVTSELGKNRKERNERTYPKIRKNPHAIIVKLCDRISNISHSKQTKNSMFEKYSKEHRDFVNGVIDEEALDKYPKFEWILITTLVSILDGLVDK